MTTPAVQIAHIKSCDCIPELRSYWLTLKDLQPDMAKHSDVMVAKETRRLELLDEREDQVRRISRAA
jgi:hypothetical protein